MTKQTFSAYYTDKNGQRVYVVKNGTFEEVITESQMKRKFHGIKLTIEEERI